MAVTAAAIIAAVIGAGMAISGGIKTAKGNRIEKSNTRPVYDIPQEETDNLNLAESLAGQGLSSSSKQIYLNNANQGLSSSIDAILKSGGDSNSINRAYGTYTQNLSPLVLADDNARLQHINMLIAQRGHYAEQRDKKWQINQFAPFVDKAKAAAELKAQGDKQMWQGISEIGSGVTSYFGNFKQKQDINNIGNMGGGGAGSSDTPGYGVGLTAGGGGGQESQTNNSLGAGDWNNLSQEQKSTYYQLLGNTWN